MISLIRTAWICFLLCSTIPTGAAEESQAQWIWAGPLQDNSQPRVAYFRKTFQTPPLNWKAVLTVAGGDRSQLFLNGQPIAATDAWDKPIRLEISVKLNQGTNVLTVRAEKQEGPAGILAIMELTGGGGERLVVSDTSWLVSTTEIAGWAEFTFDDAGWARAVSLGKLGDLPWGDLIRKPAATAASAIEVMDGFSVELIRSAGPEEGSWICLATDPQGRLTISPQGDDRPLLRLTLNEAGHVSAVEPIPAPVRYAMGLLYAHDSLYVNGRGPEGAGLYRLIDSNGNDQFEANEVRLLKKFKGGGEHGYHALALGPDGMIYILNGNSTDLPEGVSAESPFRNFSGDRLPIAGTDTEKEAGLLGAPAGYLLRTDPEGKTWELLLGGLRNAYDFDIDPEGEIFIFDSDMEWDWGSSWYRPTRILHGVPGAEFGWRSGIELWPEEHPDSLPSVVQIGLGSPTGVKFGRNSHFPAKFRRALFAMDWSYGRILLVHLEPNGASYRGRYETFLKGRPLNVTDLDFGKDGAMYFITGGRGTQSGLYRVSHVGRRDYTLGSAAAPTGADLKGRELRQLRRKLEIRAGKRIPGTIDQVWNHLDHDDRWIRYAARIALESQPAEEWSERALSETRPNAGLTALLALARQSGAEIQGELIKALARFPWSSLSTEQRIAKCRVLELSLIRHGQPEPGLRQSWLEQLTPHFPAGTWELDRELTRLLIYLSAPGAVERTLGLLESAPTQEQQIHYAVLLAHADNGWNLEQRRRYFRWWQSPRTHAKHPEELLRWFTEVGRQYTDGAHLGLILQKFRERAVARLNETERATLGTLINPTPPQETTPSPATRPFVREWTMADFARDLDRLRDRDFEKGRRAFIDAQCLACHRMGDQGGAAGPELTAAASKYTARDLLESVLEPSRVISEQYENTVFVLKNGEEIAGRITAEDNLEVMLLIDPLQQTTRQLRKSEIQERHVSKISAMPEGLVNVLEKEEILDLLAYLQAAGQPGAPVFRKY